MPQTLKNCFLLLMVINMFLGSHRSRNQHRSHSTHRPRSRRCHSSLPNFQRHRSRSSRRTMSNSPGNSLRNHPLWKTVQHLRNQSLKPNTKRTYQSCQFKYIAFCNKEHSNSLPIDEATMSLFIASLYNDKIKGTSMSVYLAAIRHLHVINDFPEPTRSCQANYTLKGAEVESSPPRQVKPITFSILESLCKSVKSPDSLMIKAAFATLFFGCLRASEICIPDHSTFKPKDHVTISDVKFDYAKKYFSLFIKKSKTDYYSNGITVYIGCSEGETCAFCMLSAYMASFPPGLGPNHPLFTHHQGIPLNKSYLISTTKLLLGRLGLNPKQYSGHSFRTGVSSTASKCNFQAWELQMLGRWRSSTYLKYLRKPKVTTSFAKRLSKFDNTLKD